MRIGMALNYSGGFKETVAELADYEKAGLDIVYVAEAYSFDAVSQLGYIAAKTERVEIASGILPIYSRTPTLLAMTAAGLDFVSEGRFTLGIGASGPQVIEGFHGVPYHAPLGRTREVVEICRKVWKRERLQHEGKHYAMPLPEGQGTGLGKPLKIINHPVREDIPILVAAIGPKNVEMTAEIANAWEPIFYLPEKAADVWGASLAAGKAKRDPSLGELDIVGQAPLAIGDDVQGFLEFGRPMAALYIGGMGAKGKNFYNDLCRRYGWEKEAEEIQDLYLAGKKDEAAAKVPYELLEKMSLIGSEGHVRERLAAMKASGVTTLNVSPIAGDHKARLALIEKIKEMAEDV
ncbi:LLM class F420-dependent oxidoreductase [Actinomadura kijaniata]|uniref:LLM class F420-dependent oxidoreductase n=1 Tax=Actinomadura kijaniata TaxID=46161 RepID=UPI00082A33F6|nr:LLM class F420-dependent oxidoreductase [Actinomadura kijaniata]